MKVESILYLMPLLPFLGFLTNGLLGRRIPKPLVGPIACLGPLIAFAIAVQGFIEVRPETARALSNSLGDWMRVAGTSVGLSFGLDKFQAVLALVVTGVGSLIHIYSIGYMRDDPGYPRFFAYLNFFMAAMLVLVLADNLVLCFLGWEGVGLASYLLIGFWFDDEANAAAGRKAFVVNRIGDFGFILGIFLVSISFGTVRFSEIVQSDKIAAVMNNNAPGILTAIALLLFLGATGKSAQIPLYVWLPDAMAGPTPVSALIHAATMVTSGVFVLARLQPIYDAAPGAQAVVAAVGGLTALAAGFIALSQFDIKKVLAYSTVSQLGYMFVAAGLGQGPVAVFHLVTHAFFKALLFLGAGAVIYSLHHEQDLRRMGGLRKTLPRTFAVFLVGSLAIAGFPFFSGFFSKDAILDAAWHKAFGEGGGAGWIALWAIALLTAAMTSFYTFRLVAMAFFGQERWKENPAPHGTAHGTAHGAGGASAKVHDAPAVMLAPLYVLAFLSVVGGFIDVPGFLTGRHEAHGWIAPITGTAAFLLGLLGAWHFYGHGSEGRDKLFAAAPPLRALHGLSAGKLFVDEVYGVFVVRPIQALASGLYYLVDRIVIDFLLVEGLGGAARGTGAILRRMQTGRVPSYATWFIAGVVAVLAAIAITGVR